MALGPTAAKKIVRELLTRRDGEFCSFCGNEMGEDCTIDHIVPSSEGGTDTLENLRLMHKSCNARSYMLGRKHTIETKQKLREMNLGKTLTEEHKRKVGQAMRKILIGRKRPDHSRQLLGRKLSNAHKKAISRGVKRYWSEH